MKEIPPNVRHQLGQLQQAQQQAQALMSQKQQLELLKRETERALEELEKLKEDAVVYKTVGPVMLRSKRDDLKKELGEQKETLELRIKTIERQESRLMERLREMQGKVQEALKEHPGEKAENQ